LCNIEARPGTPHEAEVADWCSETSQRSFDLQYLWDQEKRIGKILGELDNELSNHEPICKKQDLGNRWDEYMDNHFQDANDRIDRTTNKWLTVSEKKHVKSNQKDRVQNDDLIQSIKTLRTEWKMEGGKRWTKPWWLVTADKEHKGA
jgi:hypothetical protein